MTDAALLLDGVTRRFGENSGVGPIDLSVSHGEFIAIVGPSGCGKTTLLEMISGLESPDAGAIFDRGSRVDRPSIDRQIVFQDDSLFPWLSVEQNVAFGPEAIGRRRAEVATEAEEILSRFGLTKVRKMRPRELSTGLRQRVALARAIINRPPLLLLDDPFASLDEVTRGNVHDELLGFQSKAITMLLATHNVGEACVLADRVIVFSSGPARIVGEILIELPRPRKRGEVIEDIKRVGRILIEQLPERLSQ